MSTFSRYNPETRVLRVPAHVLKELDTFMLEKKKIAAIKLLRTETKCGLKEAKQAIEKKYGQHVAPEAFDIRPLTLVKSITIDFGEGEVSLSMEGLQMMTLVNMTSLGLDETRRILDLHDLLTEWEGDKNGREDVSAKSNSID